MKNILMLSIACMTVACSNENSNPASAPVGSRSGEWTIPVNEVFDGGPGKDGIRSIDNPVFSTVDEGKGFLSDDNLVVAVLNGNQVKGYPVTFLDRHEIVNDVISSLPIAVSYCPLTGSAVVIDRTIVNNSTFGVSGLLYNNNLILYDRGSDTYWSQMRLEAVNGTLTGTKTKTVPHLEMKFSAFQKIFPNAQLLVPGAGYSFGYPYGDYKTNNGTLFPITGGEDTRLSRKDRVHGIVLNDQGVAYELKKFSGNQVVNSEYQGHQILMVKAENDEFIFSFNRRASNGQTYTFEIVTGGSPLIYPFDLRDDQTGSRWNVLGEAVEGPLAADNVYLPSLESFNAYWFAWGVFYRNSVLL